MKALPSVEALWQKNKDRGLHIFLVESQGGTLEDISKYVKDRNLTFPVAIRNECDFDGYKGGNGLPYAFVVGPDGKVAWQGRDGYAAVIEKELARIKYPGLGKLDVALGYYRAAVAEDPDFSLVREYLGEAYIQLGLLEKAREQLSEIERICGSKACNEYGQLANLIVDSQIRRD